MLGVYPIKIISFTYIQDSNNLSICYKKTIAFAISPGALIGILLPNQSHLPLSCSSIHHSKCNLILNRQGRLQSSFSNKL